MTVRGIVGRVGGNIFSLLYSRKKKISEERFSSYRPIVWVFSPSSTVLFFSFFFIRGKTEEIGEGEDKIRGHATYWDICLRE